MIDFIKHIRKQARTNPKRIVYPEGNEARILQATEKVQQEKLAELTLIGDVDLMVTKAKELDLDIDFDELQIFNPQTSEKTQELAAKFFELRKHKPEMTEDKALELVKDMNYFGTMLVEIDEVDGMVSGTTYSTADTIRPALQIIKTKEKFHKVSGVFIMILEDRLMLFADTAINIEPNSHELADIASDTIQTAQKFGIDPRVAMLSFSTAGSAKHPLVDKVRQATAMVKHQHPDVLVEGELQVDAAILPEVAMKKFPNSQLKGQANILIFPDLQAGNIAYKLVERLAKAKAIGPILQGLNKPVNDLSRGCHFDDIVNVTAITVCEAQDEFEYSQVVSELDLHKSLLNSMEI